MPFNITDFFEFISQKPIKSSLPIVLTSGLILFLPNPLARILYITNFKEKYGFIIGAIFILSLATICSSIIFCIYNFFKKEYSNKQVLKSNSKLLNNLELSHKTIIYALYIKKNHTLELPLNDGLIKYLEDATIIVRTTNQYVTNSLRNPLFPYMLQPWVVKELQGNKKLFKSFEHEINTNKNMVDDIVNTYYLGHLL